MSIESLQRDLREAQAQETRLGGQVVDIESQIKVARARGEAAEIDALATRRDSLMSRIGEVRSDIEDIRALMRSGNPDASFHYRG